MFSIIFGNTSNINFSHFPCLNCAVGVLEACCAFCLVDVNISGTVGKSFLLNFDCFFTYIFGVITNHMFYIIQFACACFFVWYLFQKYTLPFQCQKAFLPTFLTVVKKRIRFQISPLFIFRLLVQLIDRRTWFHCLHVTHTFLKVLS